MSNKKICVFDVEANGINPDKIWCLTASIFSEGEWRSKTTSNMEEMRKFLLNTDIVVGHNIARWDLPVLERILNIDFKNKYVDTLMLSWYLYPNKLIHGLEVWGEYFGIPKPKITEGEWLGPLEGETEEVFMTKMINRCSEDVKINCSLWDMQFKFLVELYDGEEGAWDCIWALMDKMSDAREAERSGWKLDVERAQKVLNTLELAKMEKEEALAKAMPPDVKMAVATRPENLYKKGRSYVKPKNLFKRDCSLSSTGIKWEALCKKVGKPFNSPSVYVPSEDLTVVGLKWLTLLKERGLEESWDQEISYIRSSKEGNPNSSPQIKDWLTSLGWEPEEFNTTTLKDGTKKEVPQVRVTIKGEKQLCPSVKKLYDKEPSLELLEGLSVISHRISIFKGFLKEVDENGFIKAQVQGLTNTWRFKHKTIVNLPGVDKPYGEDVRGVLIAPEGMELCGSDMSSLEDRTKLHYMWEYDPEYVKEMMSDDFDPHLSIAVSAGFISKEEMEFFKWYKNKNK